MKDTLTVHQIADRLKADTNANWSYNGALVLAEWLDEIEDENEEFCCATVRSEWSEYASAVEAASDCYWDAGEETEWDNELDKEKSARTWLEKYTTVLEVKGGGVIIGTF